MKAGLRQMMGMYECKKIVHAVPIKEVVKEEDRLWLYLFEHQFTRELTEYIVRIAITPIDEKHGLQHAERGGFFVMYVDGYWSFSPTLPFTEGYYPLSAQPNLLDTVFTDVIKDDLAENRQQFVDAISSLFETSFKEVTEIQPSGAEYHLIFSNPSNDDGTIIPHVRFEIKRVTE